MMRTVSKKARGWRLKDFTIIEVTGILALRVKLSGLIWTLSRREGSHHHWVLWMGLKSRFYPRMAIYTGIGERGMEKELDKVVQFERFGFVKIDS